MKKWLSFGLMGLAYVLALLHVAIPHHHGAIGKGRLIITAAGCETAGSTGGFLQTVFSANLGYRHLETFSKSSDAATDVVHPVAHLPALSGNAICVQAAGSELLELWTGYAGKLHKQFLLFSASPLRAPPVV